MGEHTSITGEISLLWQDVDRYAGDVLLMNLDTDETLVIDTFELTGPLAQRYKDGALAEGMRVRVDCRAETIEQVDLDTGATHDAIRLVVEDLAVIAAT